jgi:hypothetical protein
MEAIVVAASAAAEAFGLVETVGATTPGKTRRSQAG